MNRFLFEEGMRTRRQVLGDAYVNAALEATDEFTFPIQEFATQYCWGDIWNRPGLDRKTRSLLNLAILTAMNRPHELRTHIRGALNNGLTKSEIGEVFLQTAIYCGIPAALDSFRTGKDVFSELGV